MLRIFQSKQDILIKVLLMTLILGGNYYLNIDLNPYITHFKVIVQDCYI